MRNFMESVVSINCCAKDRLLDFSSPTPCTVEILVMHPSILLFLYTNIHPDSSYCFSVLYVEVTTRKQGSPRGRKLNTAFSL